MICTIIVSSKIYLQMCYVWQSINNIYLSYNCKIILTRIIINNYDINYLLWTFLYSCILNFVLKQKYIFLYENN